MYKYGIFADRNSFWNTNNTEIKIPCLTLISFIPHHCDTSPTICWLMLMLKPYASDIGSVNRYHGKAYIDIIEPRLSIIDAPCRNPLNVN